MNAKLWEVAMRNRLVRALGCILFLTAVSAQVAALELVSSDVHPETYPTVQAVKHMDALLQKKTGGKLHISVAHSGQLGSEAEAIARVRKGQQAMARVSLGQFAEQVPQVTVISLPFIFRNVYHMRKVIDGPLADEIAAPFEKLGLVVLAFYDSGARSIYTVGKPVRGPEDIKGMRIRVQRAGPLEDMIVSLGGTTAVVPYNGVLEALKTRMVDGAENNWPSFVSAGHYEVARYITLTEHTITPEVLILSKAVWDHLSPEDKKAMKEAARESVFYMRKLWDEAEANYRAKAEKAGVKVVELLNYDRMPFVKAMRPHYDRVLSTDGMREFAAKVQKVY